MSRSFCETWDPSICSIFAGCHEDVFGPVENDPWRWEGSHVCKPRKRGASNAAIRGRFLAPISPM
jgi:hypothetical protein